MLPSLIGPSGGRSRLVKTKYVLEDAISKRVSWDDFVTRLKRFVVALARFIHNHRTECIVEKERRKTREGS